MVPLDVAQTACQILAALTCQIIVEIIADLAVELADIHRVDAGLEPVVFRAGSLMPEHGALCYRSSERPKSSLGLHTQRA